VFGRGGTAVEVINDKALALPPLDLKLAHDLMARTRVSRILKAYRDVPAVDETAVALVLVKLAQLAADFPQVREVDLNPFLADESGLIAVDTRVAVAPVDTMRPGPSGHPRFAIRPYPKQWERHVTLADGTAIFVRPVRPEDEPLYGPFFANVTPQDLRMRFFAPVKEFTHGFIARLTQIDYARAMALMAIAESSGKLLGVVRLHANANYDAGEHAILVRSDLKGQGLGRLQMQLIIEYAAGPLPRTPAIGVPSGTCRISDGSKDETSVPSIFASASRHCHCRRSWRHFDRQWCVVSDDQDDQNRCYVADSDELALAECGLMSALVCLGLGYCARHYVGEFGGRFDRLIGTTRSAERAEALGREPIGRRSIDMLIFDGKSASPELAVAISEADALLISAAPAEGRDPVLAVLADEIARAPRGGTRLRAQVPVRPEAGAT